MTFKLKQALQNWTNVRDLSEYQNEVDLEPENFEFERNAEVIIKATKRKILKCFQKQIFQKTYKKMKNIDPFREIIV